MWWQKRQEDEGLNSEKGFIGEENLRGKIFELMRKLHGNLKRE